MMKTFWMTAIAAIIRKLAREQNTLDDAAESGMGGGGGPPVPPPRGGAEGGGGGGGGGGGEGARAPMPPPRRAEAPPAGEEPAAGVRQARMLYAYEAANDVELSVAQGVIVEVVEQVSDDFWLCRFEGAEGMVQSDYFEFIADEPAPPPRRKAPVVPSRGTKPAEAPVVPVVTVVPSRGTKPTGDTEGGSGGGGGRRALPAVPPASSKPSTEARKWPVPGQPNATSAATSAPPTVNRGAKPGEAAASGGRAAPPVPSRTAGLSRTGAQREQERQADLQAAEARRASEEAEAEAARQQRADEERAAAAAVQKAKEAREAELRRLAEEEEAAASRERERRRKSLEAKAADAAAEDERIREEERAKAAAAREAERRRIDAEAQMAAAREAERKRKAVEAAAAQEAQRVRRAAEAKEADDKREAERRAAAEQEAAKQREADARAAEAKAAEAKVAEAKAAEAKAAEAKAAEAKSAAAKTASAASSSAASAPVVASNKPKFNKAPPRRKTGKLGGVASMWEKRVNDYDEGQKTNVFSAKHEKGAKIDKSAEGYGKAKEGSKTAGRAKAASAWVQVEMKKLITVIEDVGTVNPDAHPPHCAAGNPTICFGPLFYAVSEDGRCEREGGGPTYHGMRRGCVGS